MAVSINITNTVDNHHAIVGYFGDAGYIVETMRFVGDNRIGDNGKPYGRWMVDLLLPDEGQLLMDKVAGKFSNLEEQIISWKKLIRAV